MRGSAELPGSAGASLGHGTHEVLNQPGELSDHDAFAEDRPLVEAVRALGAG